ncbi:MAG: radical SAM protein [Candidatus Omnitrophota bacterium]|nr:radical SAM protein [Candidatus Omnitrophota bacterium]
MRNTRLSGGEESFLEIKRLSRPMRLPLEGGYFLTHRCNNNCRHCWVSIPADSPRRSDELTFAEIKTIAGQARAMGCRKWNLTGGEPMLRPDFYDIFDFLTRPSSSYTLNTNGTLITPKIARLLQRKGLTLVSLYGADAAVHDHITRREGSFAQAIQGIAYLKEAGANFMVQLMPMRDNVHQFTQMVKLAKSLSKRYRLGGSWLYLSAHNDARRNQEIKKQRLPPAAAIELEQPSVACDEGSAPSVHIHMRNRPLCGEQGYFFSCAAHGTTFSLDPYGRMSFCAFMQNPHLFYDLRRGDFSRGWEGFFKDAAQKFPYTDDYRAGCGSCSRRAQCKWCPAYAYLEHGDFSKKITYLCRLARSQGIYKKQWIASHRRYYQVAGITLQVDSDVPLAQETFHKKFALFEASTPGKDIVRIRHHRGIPRIRREKLGKIAQRSLTYEIFRNDALWTYIRFDKEKRYRRIYYLAVSDQGHRMIDIYHRKKRSAGRNGFASVTFPGSDRILLVYLLAERSGCILHASGVNFKGKGFIFLGSSGAGKSTIAKMLADKAEVLCDESIIVRKEKSGFVIYGNWCHGTFKKVSAGSAPLEKIFVLEKALENRIEVLYNKKEIVSVLLRTVNRGLMTGGWWKQTLDIIEEISREVPFYRLRFDKSGAVTRILEEMR